MLPAKSHSLAPPAVSPGVAPGRGGKGSSAGGWGTLNRITAQPNSWHSCWACVLRDRRHAKSLRLSHPRREARSVTYTPCAPGGASRGGLTPGVPVATVSVGGARNAGLLAARILAAHDEELLGRMRDFQHDLNDQATEKGKRLRAKVDGAAGGFGFGSGK